MNLTISIDEDTLEKARAFAQRQGTSVQELLRDHLRLLAGERSKQQAAREWHRLVQEHGGHSGGRYRFRREDAYDGRL